MNRADADPTVPVSTVSTWWTSSASADVSGERSVPARSAYDSMACRATGAPTKRPRSASSSPTVTVPRHRRVSLIPEAVKTSTNVEA